MGREGNDSRSNERRNEKKRKECGKEEKPVAFVAAAGFLASSSGEVTSSFASVASIADDAVVADADEDARVAGAKRAEVAGYKPDTKCFPASHFQRNCRTPCTELAAAAAAAAAATVAAATAVAVARSQLPPC